MQRRWIKFYFIYMKNFEIFNSKSGNAQINLLNGQVYK